MINQNLNILWKNQVYSIWRTQSSDFIRAAFVQQNLN